MMNLPNWIKFFPTTLLSSLVARIKLSPIGYRFARGAYWSLVGTICSRGLGLVAGILVGRLLGKHGLGDLGMIQSTVGVFGAVAGFGMGTMANRHVSELRLKDPVRVGRIIAMSSATTWITSGGLALGLVIFAPWIAERALAAPQLTGLVQLGAVLLLLDGINGAQTGALAGFEAFKAISRINLWTGLISFPLMVLGAGMWGVSGALGGLCVNYAFNCLMNWYALRHETRQLHITINYTGCWEEIGLFWRFNLPSVLNSVMYSFATWMCGAILVHQVNGYSGMGVFNAVKRFRDVPEILVLTLMAPLLAVLSDTFGNKDNGGFEKALIIAHSASAIIIVPVALLQIAAPWLTLLSYGADYKDGDSVVRWLMLGSIALSLVLPINSVFISMGKMWFWFGQVAVYVTLYIALGAWLIPRYGVVGFSASWTISFILSNFLCVGFVYSKFYSTMKSLQWARMFLLICVLLIPCWMVSNSSNRTLCLAVGLAAGGIFTGWRAFATYKGLGESYAGLSISDEIPSGM